MSNIEVNLKGSVNDITIFDNDEIIEIKEIAGGEEVAQQLLNLKNDVGGP